MKNLLSLLGDFEKNVIIGPWLQFVGLALAVIAIGLFSPHGFWQHIFKYIGLVGCFVSFAGFDYEKLYP